MCASICDIVRVAFVLRYCGVMSDSNDVGPSQIDRQGKRECEQEWEVRQEDNESDRA